MSEYVTKKIDDVDVFDIADNRGLSFDDFLVDNAETLNDAPVKVFKDRVMGQGGVLSDRELQVALELGHVVCEPRPSQLNTTSIDVRLGENFYLAGDARPTNPNMIFNPFDAEDVHRYFGGPLKAEPLKAVMNKVFKDIAANEDLNQKRQVEMLDRVYSHEGLVGIDDEHPIIMLRPRERILAHTDEFIGIRAPGTTSMQSRSTTGRIGVASCFCAGWGDSGYINRWTMEVNNLNETEYIPLPIGYRLAQIAFYSSGPVGTEYSKASGKYQTTVASDFETLHANWEPSAMLPRSPKDAPELAAWRQQQLDMLAS